MAVGRNKKWPGNGGACFKTTWDIYRSLFSAAGEGSLFHKVGWYVEWDAFYRLRKFNLSLMRY